MRRLALVFPLLAACSSSSPKPAVVELPAKPASSAASVPTAPPAINVGVANAPAGFSLDGDTTEWNLRTPSGTSKLTVAVTGDAVFVATELGHPSPDGFWLGLASVPAQMLPLATWEPGGNSSPLECTAPGHFNVNGIWLVDEIDMTADEPPQNKPADVERCTELLRKHEERRAAHTARFSRQLRIEPTRVQRLNEKGEWVPIEGAKIVWKPRAEGVAAEISLPLSVLPRLSEAPLTRLFVWAAPTDSSPPKDPPDDESRALKLPTPVSFGPLGKLRARVFESVQPPLYIANSREEAQYPWSGMSYDLADPGRIEWIHFGKSAQTVQVENEVLYEKKAALGDIELGHVRGFREWLAISKKGALVELVELSEGLRGVVVRDGEIHAISFKPSHYTMAYSGASPDWSVIAVGPNGQTRDPVQNGWTEAFTPAPKGGLGCAVHGPVAVMEGVETASASLDAFGWKGSCNIGTSGAMASFEVAWKWDPAKKQYTSTFTKLASAPRKK